MKLADPFFSYFQGGFTLQGLQNNITVGIMFIDAWLRGKSVMYTTIVPKERLVTLT